MLKRLLITGAGGGLGKVARSRLGYLAENLRLSDIVELGAAGEKEEIILCELGDKEGVEKLVEGCDAVLHLGGISVEDSFEKILNANIRGIYNLYEAARKLGKPRIFMASSNHAIGFHPQDERLDAKSLQRPDGLYGVSKCFAEAMASLYHDKFGVETALVRIGSCFPEPVDRRMLSTWLSYDDFISLVERVFTAPRLGCPVIYGVSDNEAVWWDNREAAYLGWRPKDSSTVFKEKVYATAPQPPADSVEVLFQGGKFAGLPIIED